MKFPIKTSTIGLAGIFSAILASTCCVAPLLAIAGAIGVSAATLTAVSSLKPYLIGVSLFFISVGIFRAFRSKPACGCLGSDKPSPDRPSSRFAQIGRRWVAGVSLLTIVLLVWPYVAGETAKESGTSDASAKSESASFTLDGFDQECCVGLVEFSLKEVDGYHRCAADLGMRKLTVWFDSTKTNPTALADAINVTDYKVMRAQSDDISAKSLD